MIKLSIISKGDNKMKFPTKHLSPNPAEGGAITDEPVTTPIDPPLLELPGESLQPQSASAHTLKTALVNMIQSDPSMTMAQLREMMSDSDDLKGIDAPRMQIFLDRTITCAIVIAPLKDNSDSAYFQIGLIATIAPVSDISGTMTSSAQSNMTPVHESETMMVILSYTI